VQAVRAPADEGFAPEPIATSCSGHTTNVALSSAAIRFAQKQAATLHRSRGQRFERVTRSLSAMPRATFNSRSSREGLVTSTGSTSASRTY